MSFKTNMATVQQLNSVVQMAEPLNALGLLADDELDAALALIQVAHAATTASQEFEAERRETLRSAAEAMVDDAELSTKTISDAIQDLAPADDVDAVTEHAYRTAVARARALTFSKVGQAAELLNDQMQEVVTEVREIAPRLAGIDTAQQAMNAGVVEDWQRLTQLQDRFNGIRDVVSKLRAYNLIPSPRDGRDDPAAWNTRRPIREYTHSRTVERGKKLGDDGRSSFLLQIEREPYVPTSRDEAVEVQRSWDRGEIEAVG